MLAARAVDPTISFRSSFLDKIRPAMDQALSSVDFSGPSRAVRLGLNNLDSSLLANLPLCNAHFWHRRYPAGIICFHAKSGDAMIFCLTDAWNAEIVRPVSGQMQDAFLMPFAPANTVPDRLSAGCFPRMHAGIQVQFDVLGLAKGAVTSVLK